MPRFCVYKSKVQNKGTRYGDEEIPQKRQNRRKRCLVTSETVISARDDGETTPKGKKMKTKKGVSWWRFVDELWGVLHCRQLTSLHVFLKRRTSKCGWSFRSILQ